MNRLHIECIGKMVFEMPRGRGRSACCQRLSAFVTQTARLGLP